MSSALAVGMVKTKQKTVVKSIPFCNQGQILYPSAHPPSLSNGAF